MSRRGKEAAADKFRENMVQLREQCWPGHPCQDLWGLDDQKVKGWVPMPRVMPYLLVGLDSIPGCGELSSTYLALWARMVEGFVQIKNERELAIESGFSGQRMVLVWRDKMRCLVRHKAIIVQDGSYGEFSFVLVRNPYVVFYEIKEIVRSGLYINAVQRTQEVGAETEWPTRT